MSQEQQKQMEDLLQEERTFKASKEFQSQANASNPSIYKQAAEDPVAFWESFARELHWEREWTTALSFEAPNARWFDGGQTNISYNCLDRHLDGPRRDKVALIFVGEEGGERRLTYVQLHTEVCRAANMLKSLGVGRGDRVAIYMPMIVEAVVSMLACARIGAVHSVVFGGFSSDSLRDRINDCEAKLLITADAGPRRGSFVPLKETSDEAVAGTPSIEKMVVFNRCNQPVEMVAGRDVWWHEAIENQSDDCPAEWMEAEDMLFLLYTSGTTGKPKGIIHTTGGYMVHTYATSKLVFDLKDDDVYWCTADVGWITGHSYITYGPLSNGATCLMYEGAPDYPERDRFWEICERYGVTIFYTAPTAIRAFMKWGEALPAGHDLSRLRLLGSVGEPINPEAWIWYHRNIGGERCPIVDTWWQTETGGIMISHLPGICELKPGSAGWAFPGIEAKILNDAGEEIKEGSGFLAITKPWPGMTRGIYGDADRFTATYWSRWPGIYFPGDGAKIDTKGNITVIGRVDDVINVSGHRLGTMEVESALVDHPMVAEAACVGKAHDLKGQCVVAFVTLKQGVERDSETEDVLKQHVAKKIGAIARPEQVVITPDLPKTRSGKIMRRILKALAEGREVGDTTTLADASVVERLRQA